MPVYTYKCPGCEEIIESQHSINMLGKTGYICTACNEELVIVIQPSPIHFKGAGWTPKGR